MLESLKSGSYRLMENAESCYIEDAPLRVRRFPTEMSLIYFADRRFTERRSTLCGLTAGGDGFVGLF
jgi:hypothetical protein